MVLQPANKHQIIQECHNFKNIINDLQKHPVIYQAKVS